MSRSEHSISFIPFHFHRNFVEPFYHCLGLQARTVSSCISRSHALVLILLGPSLPDCCLPTHTFCSSQVSLPLSCPPNHSLLIQSPSFSLNPLTLCKTQGTCHLWMMPSPHCKTVAAFELP